MNGWDKKLEEAAMDFGDTAPAKKATKRESDRPEARPPRRGRRYQRTYYERKKEELAAKARQRWETNEGGYRDRGLQRARDKRAHLRTKTADEQFQERVETTKQQRGECDACGRTSAKAEVRPCKRKLTKGRCKGTLRVVDGPVRTKKPRRVLVNGKPASVYSSGTLALRCGRSPATVRTWIEHRVIPGYSYDASKRYWFTVEFIEAVAMACRKVLFIDGRSPLSLVRRYVRQELEEQGIFYIPFEDPG